jgi:hypothetical protein
MANSQPEESKWYTATSKQGVMMFRMLMPLLLVACGIGEVKFGEQHAEIFCPVYIDCLEETLLETYEDITYEEYCAQDGSECDFADEAACIDHYSDGVYGDGDACHPDMEKYNAVKAKQCLEDLKSLTCDDMYSDEVFSTACDEMCG